MADINNEADVARVLEAVGARTQAPQALTESVRAAVHAQWRAAVAERARRRRVRAVALAAGVLLAVFGLWAARPLFAPRGESVMTDGSHYSALAFPGGVSVRLDHDTHIMRLSPEHLLLRHGAVYVDAGVAPHPQSHLRIDTPVGAVSHLGTQYEVRLLPGGTRIRVREGHVQLHGRSSVVARAREQLLVSSGGTVTRSPIDSDDPEWSWAARAAPAFAIEGRTLSEFLAWAGRELGQEIEFATAKSEAEAADAVLHGSIEGLTPAEALDAVLPTTRLRSSQGDGRILIKLQ